MDKVNNGGFYSFRERSTQYGSFALELVPGSKCQLRCRNCYKGKKVASALKNFDMSDDFVFDAIRQAKECGFAEIVFIGGEPTLHNSLPRFMKFALEMGLTPIVATNGIKLSDSGYAETIALKGTTLVLHAPLPAEAQDRHVGLDGYSKLLLKAYDHVLGREGVTVVGEVSILYEFIPHIDLVYRWCLDHGVIPFFEASRRDDNGNCYSGNLSPEEIEKAFDLLKELDPNPSGPLVPPAYKQPCTMSITGLHVKNFGRGDFSGVYSCCAQHIRHGDLREQPLAEIMERPSLEIFRHQDKWITGPCKNCQHYAICHGGCRGEAFLTYGCPRASYPCWHIPFEVRNNPLAMTPQTCDGCPLRNNPSCRLN